MDNVIVKVEDVSKEKDNDISKEKNEVIKKDIYNYLKDFGIYHSDNDVFLVMIGIEEEVIVVVEHLNEILYEVNDTFKQVN